MDEGGVVGGALLSVVGPAASWFSRRASRGASRLSDALDGGGGRGLDDGAAGAASSGTRKVPCTPCFVAGTLVLSGAGLVAIDQLQPGAVVLAREEYGEQVDWRQILATHVTEDRELVELRIESEEGLEVLITTPEHPFATPGGDWVRAGDLDVGELLVTVDGDLLHLQSSTWLAERATVFNLEVDDFHTYFVGETGVLVHNGKGPCGEGSDGLASEGRGSLGELFYGGATPKASVLKAWAEKQGWKPSQSATGPLKHVDESGVVRVTLKKGSPNAPGSGSPHIELRNAQGQRIDPAGNPVTRKSPGNHTPIEWDL